MGEGVSLSLSLSLYQARGSKRTLTPPRARARTCSPQQGFELPQKGIPPLRLGYTKDSLSVSVSPPIPASMGWSAKARRLRCRALDVLKSLQTFQI